MGYNIVASTEREFYVILICDKLRQIYNELHISPTFSFLDVAGVFDGKLDLYEMHKEEIFDQLGLKEDEILDFEVPSFRKEQ